MQRIIRILSFISLNIFFIYCCGEILKPKQSFFEGNYYSTINNINKLPKETIDVLYLGTSHVATAVSPIIIEKEYGIKGYNLGTAAQSITLSYFLLNEFLKKQKPSVVIFDITSLYITPTNYIKNFFVEDINSLPISLNKIKLIKHFSKIYGDNSQILYFIQNLIPLYNFHNNWKNIKYNKKINCFTDGQFFNIDTHPCIYTVETMNSEAQNMQSRNISNNILYSPKISSDAEYYFLLIQDLCKKNNINLVCVKIPSIIGPSQYPSAWTKIISNNAKEFLNSKNCIFLDLLYDSKLDINLVEDFCDGGKHLNFKGAQKVSLVLGEYINKNYHQTNSRNINNRNILLYDRLLDVAKLQTEQNFSEYISLCKKMSTGILFISAKDNGLYTLTEEQKDALVSLGLKTDFSNLQFSDAFLAVVDLGNQTVLYEKSSPRELVYSITISNSNNIERNFYLESRGYLTRRDGQRKYQDTSLENINLDSSIIFKGRNYSPSLQGLNFVLYDKDSDLIIDAVNFDTFFQNSPIRLNSYEFERKYEEYLSKF